ARIVKILLQTAIFAILVGVLARRFGWLVATLAGCLIAFDPFVNAIDSVLHVDSLAAILLVTAIVALPDVPGLSPHTLARWLLAGILSGTAVLTRWMTLVVLFPVGLMLLFHAYDTWNQQSPARPIRVFLITGMIFTG